MRWPWVSRGTLEAAVEEAESLRRAFDDLAQELVKLRASVPLAAHEAVVDERNRLREQNDGLVESLTRIQRHQAGMAETPREPRRELAPMPKELADHFNAFANRKIGKMQRDTAYRRHARGEPWEAIVDDLMGPADEEATG